MTANRSIKSVCPYCGVGCGIVMDVAAGRVARVSGDKAHPSNHGRLCTKGLTCAQVLEAPGRLEHAYLRRDRRQEPAQVPLEQAITEAATRLRDIIDRHGPDAVALYVSGQMSLEAQYLANKLIKGYIGTNNIEANSRLCMASASQGYKLSLGADGPPGSYEDFDQARLFFVIGANMTDCHPILFLRMMERVKAGARLIVVDPRRNATAEKADLFLQIKPGTDLALLNGILHLLVKNGRLDQAFIARFTEGWDAMPAFLDDYSPEIVAEITGLNEADIRKAAAWIGAAPEWMSCWTMGLNQSVHGTWHTNALCNLHLATGAICRPGSGPFSLTGQPNAMGGREMGYMGPGLPGQRSALIATDRTFTETLWQLPPGTLRSTAGVGTVGLFEAMAQGSIKACWIICTNPVATMPNRDKVTAALRAAELVIVQDAFLDTETNRYADILLPGALWAEGEGVMVNSERNLTLMQQAVAPPGDALPDWQLIVRVACAMGYEQGFSYADSAEIFEEIKRAHNPDTGYDLRGASYTRLRRAPLQWPCASDDELDRHPIRYLNEGGSQRLLQAADGTVPRLAFPRADGKARFFPRPYLPPAELPDADFPFVLNTGRLQHQWHSMTKTGKVAALNRLNPGPFVELHPDDAASLGIQVRDKVIVRSRRGRAVFPAVLSRRVLPGTCFVPFHWNDGFGEALAINAVTDDAVDPLSLQPAFKYCAVALKRMQVQPAREDESTPALALVAETVGNLVAPHENAPIAGHAGRQKAHAGVAALATWLGCDTPPELPLDGEEKRYLQGYFAGLGLQAPLAGESVPVLPATAPLHADKRLLLDGMLAGLFARKPVQALALPEVAEPARSVTMLWASQTGNSEDCAKRCAGWLRAAGYAVSLADMDSCDMATVPATTCLLLCTSTTGDGDPPDNAAAFWQALQCVDAPNLCNTAFAVLALGDSSYEQFCGFGRQLDARLEALGAKRLVARVDCEQDFEDKPKAWLEAVLQALRTTGASSDTGKVSGAGQACTTDTARGPVSSVPADERSSARATDRANPAHVRLVLNHVLNAPGTQRETRQLAFAREAVTLPFEVGDALGIWPTHCPALVGELLTVLGLAPDVPVKVAGRDEMSLADAFTRHLEITRLTPELLRFVQERAHSEKLRALLELGAAESLQQWSWGRQPVDLLREFPVAAAPQQWTDLFKRLQPRLYSISSSPKAFADQVQLTVSTLRYVHEGKTRGGVCSTFLADRADGEVPVFVQQAAHFRPPRDTDAPMIMVGPGTGVAPFRAFLQERRAVGARGRNWLLFGERHAATDFYYREELEQLRQDGYLHRLDTAFSRDQAEKRYVQHCLLEQGALLWAELERGGHFYVCGDAKRMARDVDAALKQVVARHGGMSEEDAADYVMALAREKRYLRDVY